jgi:hypothetical protein
MQQQFKRTKMIGFFLRLNCNKSQLTGGEPDGAVVS